MITLIITGICAVLLLVLGLFIKKGKGLMFLAGYNTMPKEERDKVDKRELSKTAGNLLLRMAVALALLGVTIYFKLAWAAIVLLAVLIADPFISAIRMSRKTTKTQTSKNRIIIAILITAIVLIAVGIMFYFGEKEPEVSVSDNTIQIEAMYGLDINFSDVTAIALIEKSMQDIGVGHRNNGYGGFGETLKGHFDSDELGDYLLFVKSGSAPTIWIKRDGKEDVYISFSDREKTEALYQELKTAVPEE